LTFIGRCGIITTLKNKTQKMKEYRRRKVSEIATAIHDLNGGVAGEAFEPEVADLVPKLLSYWIRHTP
jgi:hypothetical protein